MLSDVEGTDTDRATLAGLAADARDWRREALEEVADGLVYVACGLVKAAPAGGAGSETRQRAAEEVRS